MVSKLMWLVCCLVQILTCKQLSKEAGAPKARERRRASALTAQHLRVLGVMITDIQGHLFLSLVSWCIMIAKN